jgi:hypothetical protein
MDKACLGYPQNNPDYPDSQMFQAWAVYSRPMVPWPHEDIDTGLKGVDENPAAIGPNDEIVVQGSELMYSSKDGGQSLSLSLSHPSACVCVSLCLCVTLG